MYLIGFDKSIPLWKARGKVELIESLSLENPIYMVGDGYTDLEVKLYGSIKGFMAYTETVSREAVISQADYVCSDFKEVLNVIENEKRA